MKAHFLITLAGLLTGGGMAWLTPAGRVFAPGEGGRDSLSAGNSDIGPAANYPAVSPSAENPHDATVFLESLRALVDLDNWHTTGARLYRAVEKLPPAAVAVLARAAFEVPATDDALYFIRTALHDALERIDPLAAARLSLTKDFWPHGLGGLAERDLAAAENLLTETPDLSREMRDYGWTEILGGLARRNPQAALERAKRGRPEMLKGESGEKDYEEDVGTILMQWAEHDPAAALAHYDALNPDKSRGFLYGQILKSLMVRDPVAALTWLTQIPADPFEQPELKDSQSMDIMLAAFQKNPAAARAVMDRCGNLTQKADFAGALARRDGEMAKAYIKTFSEDDARSIIPSVAAGMAVKDPAAAAQWYLEHTDGGRHGGWQFLEMTRRYAKGDPAAALQWALQLKKEDFHCGVSLVLAVQGEADLPGMQAALQSVPEGETRGGIMDNLMDHLMKSAPGKALEWAQTLDAPAQTKMLDKWIRDAGQRSEGEHESQARAAVTNLLKMPQGSVPAGELQELVYTIGLRNDNKAEEANWLRALPEGEVRTGVMQNHLNEWANDDPVAASGWIAAQLPGEVRDTGAAALVTAIVRDDPAAAFAWAVEIAQPELRAERLAETVKLWSRSNAEAARRALDSIALDPAERAELLPLLNP